MQGVMFSIGSKLKIRYYSSRLQMEKNNVQYKNVLSLQQQVLFPVLQANETRLRVNVSLIVLLSLQALYKVL